MIIITQIEKIGVSRITVLHVLIQLAATMEVVDGVKNAEPLKTKDAHQ